MKKLLALIILCLTLTTGCTINTLSEEAFYKFKCDKQIGDSCAKYLFITSWQNVQAELYPVNHDLSNWSYWKKRYLNQIHTKEDAYVAIESMLASLDDPYTRFLNQEEYAEQNMNIAAQLSGIGVVISSNNGKIQVEDVIENSPAQRNHIQTGDIILKINNHSISGMDIKNVANLIRGKAGTKVTLLIIRDKKYINKTIKREKIKIKAVRYKMLKDNIAYININTFMSQSAATEFLSALQNTKNSRAIILDMRGNQGGLLPNATFIANLLLQDGTIVQIVKKGKATEMIKVQPLGTHIDKPLVVLTNGMSASATEILAGALKENNRAVIVGEKTYGKGLIQKIMPLPLNTAMNVTVAKYLTPDGHDIHKFGIKPNYEVKMTPKDVILHKDIQLEKAIKLLSKK